MAAAFYLSLFLRLEGEELWTGLTVGTKLLPLFLFLRVGVFLALGLYDIIWRYVSTRDAWALIKGVGLSTLLIIAATYLVNIGRLPRSLFFIEMFLVMALLAGARLFRRFLYERSSERELRSSGRATLIYGAGVIGRTLAGRFTSDPSFGFQLVGFVDDDPLEVGRTIAGVKVLGTLDDLPEILSRFEVKELVVAMNKPRGDRLRALLEATRGFQIRPRLVSDFNDCSRRDQGLELLRNIELGDLLNRPKRTIDTGSLKEIIAGRRILVTGAGGSIGSELARQIWALQPSQLLLLDHNELNLYQIDSELRVTQKVDGPIVPVLLDLKDRQSLANVFERYRPEIVFHAAAYKHVHLVEHNPFTAILNNVMGTKNLLECCREIDVQRFVLISTDKAVNPVGVMGATKRVCELMVSAYGSAMGRMYCSVRFGNVLGSSGSLIPLLQRQIQDGGPLTVTHPDMIRYFMLISEAVSLVLAASTICSPGAIAILQMGEPVRILDVARSLLTLAGKTEKEIPIVFTGLRPGEKMFEELYLCGDEIITSHPDILLLPGVEQMEEKVRRELFSTIDQCIAGAQQSTESSKHQVMHLAQHAQRSLASAPFQKAVGS